MSKHRRAMQRHLRENNGHSDTCPYRLTVMRDGVSVPLETEAIEPKEFGVWRSRIVTGGFAGYTLEVRTLEYPSTVMIKSPEAA